MVRVNQYVDQASLRPVSQQGRSANVDANAFGASIGQSLIGLSQNIGQLSDAVAYRGEIIATNDARDGGYAYREAIRTSMYGVEGQGGFLTTEGNAAYGEGVRDGVMGGLSTAAGTIAEGLTPRARTLFMAEVARLNQGVLDQTATHAATQFRRAQSGTGGGGGGGGSRSNGMSYAEAVINDVAVHAGNPDVFWNQIASGQTEIISHAAVNGWDAERTEDAVRELRSRAHMVIVSEREADGDPVAAAQHLEDNRSEIRYDIHASAREALRPVVAMQNARGQIDQWNAEGVGMGPQAVEPAADVAPAAAPDAMFPLATPATPITSVFDQGRAPDAPADAAVQDFFTTEGAMTTSAQELRTLGLAATPVNEAILETYGPSTGVAIFSAVARNQLTTRMSTLIPDATGAMLGETVGSITSRLRRETAPVQTGSAGTVVNPALQRRRALEIEDPVMREAVLDELSLRAGVYNAEAEALHSANMDEAYDHVGRGGNPDTLPMALRMAIGPEDMSRLRSLFEGAAIDHNVAREVILQAASNDPDDRMSFLSRNLTDIRDAIGPQMYIELSARQQEARQLQQQIESGDAAGALLTPDFYATALDNVAPMYHAMTGVAAGSTASGVTSEQSMQFVNFERTFNAQLLADTNAAGRMLTQLEVQNLAAVLMTPVEVGGGGGIFGGARGFTGILSDVPARGTGGATVEPLIEVGAIPMQDFDRIRTQMYERWGYESLADVDNNVIVEQYEAELLMSVGVEPNITWGELPRHVKNALRAQNADIQNNDDLLSIFRTHAILMAAGSRNQ